MSGGPSTAGEIIQIQTKNKKVKPNRYLLKNVGKCQGRNFCHWIEKILIWHFNSIIDSHCDFGPSNPFIEFLLCNMVTTEMLHFVFRETSFFMEVPAQKYDQQETSQEIPQNRKSQWKQNTVHRLFKNCRAFLI